MQKKMIAPFLILAGVPFVMVLGNSMLIPVFPQMEKAMHLSKVQVGLMVTLFSAPAGLLIPFAGALSDHLGRKAIMAPALLVYGLGGLISGFAALLLAKPYAWVLVGRAVQGIGAGGTYQLAMALTGDMLASAERTKALGYLEAANGLGKVLSPMIGAGLALITWYTPFFAYSVLAIPLAALVWWVVKEPDGSRQGQSARQYIHSLAQVFREKGAALLAAYAVGAIALFLLFGLLSFLSDELETRFHIMRFAKGWVLAIPVGTMAATSFLGGLLLAERRTLLRPAILTGLTLIALNLALLLWGEKGAVSFVTLAALVALGIGMLLPPLNTMITSATGSCERGLVTCLYGTVRFLGVAAGPPTFGMVASTNHAAMYFGGAAIAAIGIVVAWVCLDPTKMMESDNVNTSR